MISDVDLSVRAWLGHYLPADVPVVFDPPDRCAQLEGDRVSAYLLEVEEDPTGVSATWDEFRDADGQLVGRRAPSRRYRFDYLLTAWADDVEREHRLLGDLLVGCAGCLSVPAQFLSGALAQPVLVRSAPRREGVLRAAPARTGLHLQLLVPLVPETMTDLAPPPREVSVNSSRGVPPARRAGISEPG